MRIAIKKTILTIFLTVCGVMLSAATAEAATYIVDTTADDAGLTACTAAASDCSLRGAIANASASAGVDDTINFALPAVSTITLGSQLPIAYESTLTISNSTGSSNLMISGGSAVRVFYVLPRSKLILEGVTITNGSVQNDDGGGIMNLGKLTLNNSTVSGNSAETGGGIFNAGLLNINNSTIAFNSSPVADCEYCIAGILNYNTINMYNTIVAQNTVANSSVPPDFSGTITSGSYNLIGDGTEMTGITNGTNGNQVGTSANPIDPKLAPLADNGGTTFTHALQTGSPAIDKGNATGSDQRGESRPSDNLSITNVTGGNGADIGAFEVQFAPTAGDLTVSGQVKNSRGKGIANVILTLTDALGVERTARTNMFGFYRFTELEAGGVYFIRARAKSYNFGEQKVISNAVTDYDGVDFIGMEIRTANK